MRLLKSLVWLFLGVGSICVFISLHTTGADGDRHPGTVLFHAAVLWAGLTLLGGGWLLWKWWQARGRPHASAQLRWEIESGAAQSRPAAIYTFAVLAGALALDWIGWQLHPWAGRAGFIVGGIAGAAVVWWWGLARPRDSAKST